MATARHKAIAELMSGLCRNRTFIGNEVALIETQIKAEFKDRGAEGITIPVKSSKGRRLLNERIAARIKIFATFAVPITAEHIHIYRLCRADEYTNRTGKCSWGYASIRARNGYDPKTGQEVV